MVKLQHPWLARAALGLLFFVMVGCDSSPEPVKLTGSTMGTSYHITLQPTAEFDVQHAQQDIDDLLKVFSQITSTYIPDSEINGVSQLSVGEWHTISETLSDILLLSMEVNWLTAGAFDVTVSPLVDLWGFGRSEQNFTVPDDSAIAEKLAQVGFQNLQLDFTEPRLLLKQPLTLDLSAIAKGYGVDMVAQWLRRNGIENFLVEIGGEIRAAGHSPRGDIWRIGIEKPWAPPGTVQQAIRLSDVGLATSGGYRNYFEKNGVKYSHSIDPKTGRPITHNLVSVTVIAESSAYADALATGLLVLGADKALALAQEYSWAVYLVEQQGDSFNVRYSEAFAEYLDLN